MGCQQSSVDRYDVLISVLRQLEAKRECKVQLFEQTHLISIELPLHMLQVQIGF
jgi:hypothetical protein